MKKCLGLVLLAFLLSLTGCLSKTDDQNAITQWDCSVTCAGESTADEYIITYSDEEITPQTGSLTFQNRNAFDIVVHVFCEGNEICSDRVPAGGVFSILHVSDNTYTIGVHADVAENTEIKLMVYDGQKAEPY